MPGPVAYSHKAASFMIGSSRERTVQSCFYSMLSYTTHSHQGTMLNYESQQSELEAKLQIVYTMDS